MLNFREPALPQGSCSTAPSQHRGFSSPGAELRTFEPHEMSSGPVLKPSNVLLAEVLPFDMPSHPPDLMSSANLLVCHLCPCPGH